MNVSPTPKVATGVIAGSIVTILIWIIQTFFKVTIPAEVAAAATTILSFFASWIAPKSNA